jgi:uroporphyrinogen decarboxylase
MTTSQHRLLQTLNQQPVDRPPIWLMRQAGRYLPEYRAIRKTMPDFMSLCRHTDLAAEITLQPLARFALDAAIIFSDILTIPDAMGLGLTFQPNQGPVFTHPIQADTDIQALSNDVTADLGYVFDAISQTKRALNQQAPLIGFSGSPWTLAAYMVEGRGSQNFAKTCQLAVSNPTSMQMLLQCLTNNVIAYCRGQIDAGADVIMLFDSHGARLPETHYQSMSLDYLQQIISALNTSHPHIPTIVYGKVNTARTIQMASTGARCIGVSHLANLQEVRAALGNQVVLQGNIDPAYMSQSEPDGLVLATQNCLKAHGTGPCIINLGHGIRPDARIEQVHTLQKTVANSTCPTMSQA